jgi:hypothetical protein
MKQILGLMIFASSAMLVGMESNSNSQSITDNQQQRGLKFINSGSVRFYDFPESYSPNNEVANVLDCFFEKMATDINPDWQGFIKSYRKSRNIQDDDFTHFASEYGVYARHIMPCVSLPGEDAIDPEIVKLADMEENKLGVKMPSTKEPLKVQLKIADCPELASISVTYDPKASGEKPGFKVTFYKSQANQTLQATAEQIITVPSGMPTAWAVDPFGKFLVGTDEGKLCSFDLEYEKLGCEVSDVHTDKITGIRMIGDKGFITQSRTDNTNQSYIWARNGKTPLCFLPSMTYSSDYIGEDVIVRSKMLYQKATQYPTVYNLPWMYLLKSGQDKYAITYWHALRTCAAYYARHKKIDADLLSALQKHPQKDNFAAPVSKAISQFLKECAAILDLQKKVEAEEKAKAVKEAEKTKENKSQK